MEHLHEDLIVQIYEKKPLNTSTNSHNDNWMLKYTIQNLGFICFLMRADFQQSENIQLLRLSSSKTWTKISSLSFESEVRPFENKEIVRAMKINPKERAFVRVQYEVIEEKDMPLDQVMENQTQEKQEMGDIIEYSTNKYQSSQQAMLMTRSMDLQDISHFYRTNDDVFLDLTFPPTLDSLLGDDFQSINETDIYTLCTFKHYQDINHLSSDKEWKLQVNYCSDDDKIIQIFPGGLPKAPGILSAFAIILERQDQNLLERMRCKLVDNFSKSSCFEFQFCLSGQWEKVLVDGFLPCFPGGGSMGISSLSHLSLSLQLIQKAYAKLKGSYSALTNVSTLQALSEMTGLPAFLLYKHEEASSISTSHVSALLQRALNSKREQLFVSFQEMTLEKMMFAVLRIENDNQGTYVVLRDMWKMLRQVYSGTVTISTGNEMTIRMPLEEFIQSVASIGMLHLSSLSLDKDQDIRRRLCFYQPDKVALDPDDMSPYQTPDYKLLDQKHLALPLESFAFCFSLTALSSVSITLYRRECSLNGRMHLIDDEEELFALALLNADYCLTSLRSKHTHTHYFVKKDEIMIEEHMFVSLPPGEYVLMTRCNINIERSQKSPPSTILHTLQSVSTPKSLYKRRSLKPESRDALRMVFRWLDVDMDDALSVKDLIEFCERYEETVPVENELKKLFESFETDANGNMTFEGFIELFETLNPGNTEALDEEVVFKMVQELLMMPYTGTAYEGQMNPDKIKEWIICIRSSSSRIDVEALRFENEELYKQMIW